MKRRWNWALWIGFVCGLAGLFGYEYLVRFPITRDFPWANLLLFACGAVLLVIGLKRAFGQPHLYRGRVFGVVFALLGLLSFTLFSYAIFYVVRQMPASAGAPRVGQKAPAFILPDQNGRAVALRDLTSGKAAVLIFYRGHW